MSALRVCGGCDRHVRESVCPFCGGAVERGALASVPTVARAVLVAGIATAAVAATASCFGAYGGPPPESPQNAQPDAATPMTTSDAG